MLVETHEVIAAAAYVQQLFEEDLLAVTEGGQLDGTWGVPGEKLDYLLRLLRAMKGALQAVKGLKLQFEQHVPGVTLPFAKQLWALRYRAPSKPLDEQLKIVSTWIDEQRAAGDALLEVAALADQIGSFTLPFRSPRNVARDPQDDELETALLQNLDELESLVGTDDDGDVGRVQNLVTGTVNIKARLGLA
jgi:hypothetical protein